MTISHEELTDLLSYDPDTGIFRWRDRRSGGIVKGQIAGWLDIAGKQWKIEINSRPYLSHRLAWFYVYGQWPIQIDHINGNRTDNRFINLREANNSQNQANMKAKSNNRLGIRGVGFRRNKYIVQLRKNGVAFNGKFETLEEAKAFAEEKSKQIHGDFSIHNRDKLSSQLN